MTENLYSPQPEDGGDVGSLRDSLLFPIIHLGVVVGRSMAEELAPYELSPVELAILLAVGDRPDCTAVMIAQLIPVETPSISRGVHRLVQKGMLARQRSEEDRRLVFLRLTSKGERTSNALLPLLKGLERRVLQALDEEQARAYRAYTDTLIGRIFPGSEGDSI